MRGSGNLPDASQEGILKQYNRYRLLQVYMYQEGILKQDNRYRLLIYMYQEGILKQ